MGSTDAPVIYREKKPLKEIDLINIDDEIKIKSIEELNVADHIIIANRDELCRFTHAILIGKQNDFSLIEIIYFSDGNEFIKRFIKKNEPDDEIQIKSGIRKTLMLVDFRQVDVYRFDYELKNRKCLAVEETIRKCEKFIGHAKYNLFVNNDEHFCIYCKTGKAAKLFILSPELTKKKVIGAMAVDLTTQGGQVVLVNTAKHVATKFPRTAVATYLPAATDAACGVLGAGVEGIVTGYDIYKKNKDYKDGRINTLKFKKYVAKRVMRGANAAAGSIAGSIVGQCVIPVPVAGAIIGGFVGGLIGAGAGQVEGLLLGEIIELANEKTQEKANVKAELANHQYHVLHHLVIKFDKTILSEENFNHLPSGKCIFYTNTVHSEKQKEPEPTEFNKIIVNAGEKLCEEDYEIYLIDKDVDNEEVVEISDSDIRNSFGNNGRVFSRHSVEEFSADQLPSDMNIYFKFTDIDE